jgi:hypothetical protein
MCYVDDRYVLLPQFFKSGCLLLLSVGDRERYIFCVYSTFFVRTVNWCWKVLVVSRLELHHVSKNIFRKTLPVKKPEAKTFILIFQYIYIYITRCDVTQFILSGNCSTCFGWYHDPSSGAQTTVSTASGICHTATATCRYRGRIGTGLSVHSTLKPVKFVVCKVALRQIFFRVLQLSTVSLISPLLQCRLHLHVASKRRKERNLGNFQEPMLFQKWDKKSIFIFSRF